MSGTQLGTSFIVSSGPSTNGVLIQLAACGIMTALLTATPSLTFFRFRYLQYTNFAMLSIVQTFDSAVGFGSTSSAKIYKAGDLLYFLYVVMTIPGIRACAPTQGSCGISQQFPYAIDANNPCGVVEAEYFASIPGGNSRWLYDNYGQCADYADDCAANPCGGGACEAEPYAYWTNAIGQVLVNKATLIIGTQTIDTLYNDYLYMWEELSGKPGKRLTEMIGKRYCTADLIADSSKQRTLYVPLPFYFTQTPGNALPLVAIMFSGATICVQFEQLQNCVITSGRDLNVVKCNGSGPLTNQDLQAALDGTQIFLDILERDRFAATWFEQLITQVYQLYTNVCCSTVRIPLGFNHPIIELIWAVRRQCQADHNNWFNYSGIQGYDPIVAAELQFNSTARQPKREASWYRLVQPYQFHTNIPDAFIYNYSFALYPEEPQPSGVANFARFESVTLILDLQDGLAREDCTVIIFARGLNILKFRDGVAGLGFA